MTGTYDWNPMPHRLDVRCRACGGHATFEFAEAVRIRRRADVPFFEQSPWFDVAVFGRGGGTSWRGAVFYAGLHGGVRAISGLPAGYAPTDWSHSRYLFRSHGRDLGSRVCASCSAREKCTLDWPNDAWFQVTTRAGVLWAFHRESAVALRDFVAAKDRAKGKRWKSFLLHVPSGFLTAKARDEVLRKLDRLLAA